VGGSWLRRGAAGERITTGTINWQTFSHLAFAFRITPT
jgi:hypothetical protein